MTIVDTNILLDLVTDDPEWFDWSLASFEAAAADGPAYINIMVYAELSFRYQDLAAVDELIEALGVQFADVPRQAAFLAAKAFARYRSSGGMKAGVLPDFLIGAHAAALGIPILTRDPRRYRTYFPDVPLIAPQLN